MNLKKLNIILLSILLIFSISCNNKTNKAKEEVKTSTMLKDNSIEDRISKRGESPDKTGTKRESRLTPDEKVENYLKPYRADLKKKTGAVIAKLEIDLTKKAPNSTLGRFAAEIIKIKAAQYSKEDIDFSILNRGGLRKALYKGNIKIKDVYELMPFDNHIVIIGLTGLKVKQMCKEIVKHHGLPVDNIQVTTNDIELKSCKVNNKEIDDKKLYKVATINYLYKVGEGVPTLKKGKLLYNMTNHLFRDAILEFVKEKKVINQLIPKQYLIIRN